MLTDESLETSEDISNTEETMFNSANEHPDSNNSDSNNAGNNSNKPTKPQSVKPNKRGSQMIICLNSNGTWVLLKNEKDMHDAYISKLTKDKNLQVIEAKVLAPKTNTSWG